MRFRFHVQSPAMPAPLPSVKPLPGPNTPHVPALSAVDWTREAVATDGISDGGVGAGGGVGGVDIVGGVGDAGNVDVAAVGNAGVATAVCAV